MTARRLARLGGLVLALLAWLLLFLPSAHAEDMSVPASVQAKLLTRVLLFDRNQPERAPGDIVVLLLVRAGDAESTSAALHMQRALAEIGTMRGALLRSQRLDFTDAAAVVREVRQRGASVVYFTPSLGPAVPDIAAALAGTSVLSFAAVESYVPAGAVLGVDVVSGKPRLSVNLRQARAQKVDFSADILALMKVYR